MKLADFVDPSMMPKPHKLVDSAPMEVTDYVHQFLNHLRSDLQDEIVISMEEVVERVFNPEKLPLLQEVAEKYGELGVIRVKKVIIPRLMRQIYLAAIDQFVKEMHEKDDEEILEDDDDVTA